MKTYGQEKCFNPLGLTEDFRKFIWQFFCYHYFERITLEKIKGSKWFQSELPQRETVLKEMTRRKMMVEEKYKNTPHIA